MAVSGLRRREAIPPLPRRRPPLTASRLIAQDAVGVCGRCFPLSVSRSQLRTEGQHLLWGRDGTPGLTAADVGQVIPQPQTQQAVAHELPGGQAVALFPGQSPRPNHQFEGHLLRLGVAVGDAPGEDVPEGDQHLAGNGDDGHVGMLAAGEALELLFPGGRFLHRYPGGLPGLSGQDRR